MRFILVGSVASALAGVQASPQPVAAPPPEAAKAGVPSWCRLIPERLLPRRCVIRAGAGGEACGRLSAEERGRTPACAYDEREALEMAYVSVATFCDEDALASWTCGKPCQELPRMESPRFIHAPEVGGHALVGKLRGSCVLAFRGTDSLMAWGQNLRSLDLARLEGCEVEGRSCRVGLGFNESYRALSLDIRRSFAAIGCTKASPLLVTGHSLGAALATLAVFDLSRSGYRVTKAYTFGSPRVGDDAFAAAFNANAVLKKLLSFRVARGDDPYVYMPTDSAFRHVGTEVYYPGNTGRGHRICESSGEDSPCLGRTGGGDIAAMLLQCVIPATCGHMRYFQPEMRGLMGRWSCRSWPKEILP